MKKLVCLVFAMAVMFSVAFADFDFSGMTESEILDVINTGRNALVIAEAENALLVFDTGAGVTLIFNGLNDRISAGYASINVTIINDSDTDYVFSGDEMYVNGWQCDDLIISKVNAHRRMNDTWSFRMRDANISSLDEVEDIEIYFTIYPDGSSRSRNHLIIEQPVILSFR